jgi:hypothetical protein
MKRSDLKELIKECYNEILAEEYTPDYSEYSNDALTDMIINLSRYEGNEDIIQMVKDELKKRKEQSKTIQEKMKQSELKALIKECYKEVIAEKAYSVAQQQAAGAALAAKKGKAPESGLKGASKAMEKMTTKELEKIASTKHKGLPKHVKENEEMDLPADTGKNINMGFDNNVGLDVDKRMSGNMSKVMSQIEMLKNKLAPFIADFKSKKLSKEQYMEATKGLVADLKKAQLALELMMAKL